jgi:hypothetical protein
MCLGDKDMCLGFNWGEEGGAAGPLFVLVRQTMDKMHHMGLNDNK